VISHTRAVYYYLSEMVCSHVYIFSQQFLKQLLIFTIISSIPMIILIIAWCGDFSLKFFTCYTPETCFISALLVLYRFNRILQVYRPFVRPLDNGNISKWQFGIYARLLIFFFDNIFYSNFFNFWKDLLQTPWLFSF
jgi:hypothetical protein